MMIKIGIVGKTGSGKTTMALAILRILESDHGEICIDNVNIKKIGLRFLRKRITLIPQVDYSNSQFFFNFHFKLIK
jgi:ABC-type multidrug transport system fused ATPase/permease subunit